MNTNFNGISELSANDLDSVSGGSDLRGAIVGAIVGKLIDEIHFVDAVRKQATGTLKGLTPKPPK